LIRRRCRVPDNGALNAPIDGNNRNAAEPLFIDPVGSAAVLHAMHRPAKLFPIYLPSRTGVDGFLEDKSKRRNCISDKRRSD
jgi:hypothetical protein